MMKIECIKGFVVVEEELIIMQGEVFEKTLESDWIDRNTFRAVEGASFNPEMEIDFTNQQLCNNFKLIGK
jgi:hypothetical protein